MNGDGPLVEALGAGPPDPHRLGGKGASLARLVGAGHRVPPGLVVTTSAFELAVRRLGLLAAVDAVTAALRARDVAAATDAARAVAERLRRGPLPGEVAAALAAAVDRAGLGGGPMIVRSSATGEDDVAHSFAGMFESLQVGDDGGGDGLEATVLAVWASAFAPRAVAYVADRGIAAVPSMAVVVQRFVDAARSGVMFTRFEGRLLIEHVEGGCEKLVKGEVTPARLWVDDDGAAAGDGLLADRHVAALVSVGRALEATFGSPQDVEWLVAGDEVHVVQSRPITAPAVAASATSVVAVDPAAGPALLTGTAAGPGAGAGAVRLSFNIEQAMALERGEVLVTPMTNPDMVVAMRRSSGIVTDVGGVICHAAIVSRELGLPCVVGTATATATLRDGQVVTVDGTGGRVFDGRLPIVAAGGVRTVGWADLWALWDRRAGALPVAPCLAALGAAPAGLTEAAVHPDLDLRDDGRGLWRDVEALPAAERGAVLDGLVGRLAGVADRLGLSALVLVPLEDDLAGAWREAVRRAGDPRLAVGTDRSTVPLAEAAAAPGPTALGPVADAVEAAVDTRRFFGHEPAVRRAPMPDPARRAAWWRLLPEYGRYHAAFATAAEGREHDWLEVRPELVISPLLKSLVQPGFEMVPPVLGFPGIGPMHVKWIRCRYHFRADTFAATWAAIVRGTWDRAWLADVLARVRRSYTQLAEVLALFPTTDEGLRSLTPAQAVALVTSWWPRWVEFFAVNWFLQAQGDDVAYPFLAETVADGLARAGPPPPGTRWPPVTDLVAPTTPVMSGAYMADVGRLRAALLAGPADDLVAEHVRRWGWMRDRDLLFEPWDTPEKVVEVALATEPHAPPDYEANRERGMLALGFHAGLAAAGGRAEAVARMGRFLHDLNVEREDHHVLWLKYSYPLRRLVVELERRLVEAGGFEPGLVFFLQAPELLAAAGRLPAPIDPALAAAARNRRAGFRAEARLEPEARFDDEDDYL